MKQISFRYRTVFIGVIILWLFPAMLLGQVKKGFTLEYTVSGIKDSMAWLCEIYGPQVIPVDSVRIVDEKVVFYSDTMPPQGMYKVVFNDTLFTDIIITEHHIKMYSDAKNILQKMQVLESEENRIMFDYWKFYMAILDTIYAIQEEGRALYAASGGKTSPELDALQLRKQQLEMQVLNYAAGLRQNYPRLFASTIIWSMQKPDYYLHLAYGGSPYTSEEAFYRQRFFDRLDFSDERLLRTKVIFTMVNDYVQTFAKPPSTKSYIRVTDTILQLARKNPKVYQYIVELFVKNFEASVWQNVFIYLVEHHYLKSELTPPYMKEAYAMRIKAMQNLEVGKSIPGICGVTTEGVEHCLHDPDTAMRFTLLFIWSLDCEECEEKLPGLNLIYKQYATKGFRVFSFAFAERKDDLQRAIDEYNLPYDVVSDYQGIMSDVVDRFNISLTPVMLLIDSEYRIVGKPTSIPNLYGMLAGELGQ